MKTRVLLFVFLLIGTIIGYLIYSKVDKGHSGVNEVIPETSALVIQIDNPKAQFQLLKSFGWSKQIAQVPLISDFQNNLSLMDSLEVNQVIKSKLSNLNTWVSLHTTGSDALTPLYVVQSEGFEWSIESLKVIFDLFLDSNSSFTTQSFNDKEIILFQLGQINLSVLIQDQFLIFSESTVLVEDVIRAVENPDRRLFREEVEIKSGRGLKALVNGNRLNELRSVFFQSQQSLGSKMHADGNFVIDINLSEEGISFSGSGEDNPKVQNSGFASIFASNFVPVSANSFSWKPVNISDEPWNQYLEPELCEIEIDGNGQASNRVFVFSVKDTTMLSAELKRLAASNLPPADSSVYQERFVNSDIGFVNDPDLITSIAPAYGFRSETQFYTIIQSFLIMSGNVDALKTVLRDFDQETTWGRSVERRPVIKDLIQETDYTFVQDFEYARDPLKNRLRGNWKTFFEGKPEILDVLGLLTLQINSTSNNLLVSGNLSFNEVYKVSTEPLGEVEEVKVLANVFADNDLVTKPFVVKNHIEASFEMVFQDNQNQLYLVTKQGEILWKKKMSGSVKGSIHQVDYYNNKKLQYLAFTDSLIYLVDRNGDDVDGFPRSFTSVLPIIGSEVVDYDNNKQYRYLATDRRGNLSLFDKDGGGLEGWNPKAIGGSLLRTPFHIRVRGRDCFVVVESTGKIHLLNRRAEEYPGFPLNIDKSLAGDVAFSAGSNFSQSLISLATVDGELLQINLDGEVVMRKQLLRSSGNNEFLLVEDALKSTFTVIKNDGKVLSFFNSKGAERFSLDYPNSKSLEVDQYNFRNGKEIFVIRDLDQNLVRIIDKEGQFLTQAIPSSEQVGILYYQNRLEYEVFVNFANQLNVYAVKPL